MRIVKLSDSEFSDVDEVDWFFQDELVSRKPRGKFKIPKGWIGGDGLHIGEPILFSFQTTVRYSALAASGRLENDDRERVKYPYYFLVDMETVRPLEASLYDIEQRLHQVGIDKSIVNSRGWPTLVDSSVTNELWASLRKED